MADLRKETHGPGSMKDVELVVIAYDNRVARNKDGEVSTHYLDGRIHPGDRRAVGQTSLALVSRPDPKAPSAGTTPPATRSGSSRASRRRPARTSSTSPRCRATWSARFYGVKADLISSSEG